MVPVLKTLIDLVRATKEEMEEGSAQRYWFLRAKKKYIFLQIFLIKKVSECIKDTVTFSILRIWSGLNRKQTEMELGKGIWELTCSLCDSYPLRESLHPVHLSLFCHFWCYNKCTCVNVLCVILPSRRMLQACQEVSFILFLLHFISKTSVCSLPTACNCWISQSHFKTVLNTVHGTVCVQLHYPTRRSYFHFTTKINRSWQRNEY